MRARKIVVVGGGLAGLCAALTAADRGASVVLLERSKTLGGRAASAVECGFTFNQGAHALYLGGPAAKVLGELGIRWKGSTPKSPYFFGERGGQLHPLPMGPVGLLRTDLLSLRGKFQLARALGKLAGAEALGELSAARWIERVAEDEGARATLAALFRVTTYCADLERLSVGAGARQMRRGIRTGVVYLDGGWQSLVDGFIEKLRDRGVELRTSAAPTAVDRAAPGFRISVEQGEPLDADALILAVGPRACASLVPSSRSLARAAETAVPVRAACLDVALRTHPNERHHFTLGIDAPVYLSVHSAFARLAPSGGALIHAARYIGQESVEPALVRAELEALIDRAEPGWRDHVVEARYLPRMLVANAIPLATSGGKRTPIAVADVPHLFVAGDWVGEDGMLADAVLGSASKAAELALGTTVLKNVA